MENLELDDFPFDVQVRWSVLMLQFKNIRIYHECEGRIEKCVPRITVWHHEGSRG